MSFLAERGIHLPAKTGAYSVNEGMWGTSVGGKETLRLVEHPARGGLPRRRDPTDLKPRTLVRQLREGPSRWRWTARR